MNTFEEYIREDAYLMHAKVLANTAMAAGKKWFSLKRWKSDSMAEIEWKTKDIPSLAELKAAAEKIARAFPDHKASIRPGACQDSIEILLKPQDGATMTFKLAATEHDNVSYVSQLGGSSAFKANVRQTVASVLKRYGIDPNCFEYDGTNVLMNDKFLRIDSVKNVSALKKDIDAALKKAGCKVHKEKDFSGSFLAYSGKDKFDTWYFNMSKWTSNIAGTLSLDM